MIFSQSNDAIIHGAPGLATFWRRPNEGMPIFNPRDHLLPPALHYLSRRLGPGDFHSLAFYAHADARGCKDIRVLSFNFEYDFHHTFVY